MPRGVYERKRKPLRERFWAKVEKRGPDECWFWTGTLRAGYGDLMTASAVINGSVCVEHLGAHRISYFLATGDWPALVRHRCHNPICVNPRHLVPGTHADNMRDMVAAGRSLVGERRPNSKLTWANVRAARCRSREGVTTVQLARDYGVSERTMRQCLAGETWVEGVTDVNTAA